jgi:UDP-glucose 4-epimerase
MRICVVTGGAGFIGSNLSERLLALGDQVRIVDNYVTGRRENLRDLIQNYGRRLEVIEGDIRNLDLLRSACQGATYVFHQAALPSVQRSIEDPVSSNEVNIQGTLNVLLAAKDAGVKRVVFASSSSVYGNSPTLPKRETMPSNPISPYALTKHVGEQYCRLFYMLYGVETVALRYFNVFGPRQDPTSEYSAVIPKFITRLLRGQPPIIHGDGEQTRDFTFVENVVDANLRAAEAASAPGEVINIACGETRSLNQLARDLNQLLGMNLTPEHDAPRAGDVRDSLAGIEKSKTLLSYEPRIGFAEGLRRSIDWYIKTLS